MNPKTRPTETATGLGLAVSVYGFLTQADVSHPVAALVAVGLAFVPAALSSLVDQVWKSKPSRSATIESGKRRG